MENVKLKFPQKGETLFFKPLPLLDKQNPDKPNTLILKTHFISPIIVRKEEIQFRNLLCLKEIHQSYECPICKLDKEIKENPLYPKLIEYLKSINLIKSDKQIDLSAKYVMYLPAIIYDYKIKDWTLQVLVLNEELLNQFYDFVSQNEDLLNISDFYNDKRVLYAKVNNYSNFKFDIIEVINDESKLPKPLFILPQEIENFLNTLSLITQDYSQYYSLYIETSEEIIHQIANLLRNRFSYVFSQIQK
jgi:hypothetical protein